MPPTRISTRAPAKRVQLSKAERQGIADELLRTIASLRRTSRRYGERPAEFSTLTGAQLELVRLVRRRPRVSVTDAARELVLASNTVSTLVRQLMDEGLMRREMDESDRRIARLELSPNIRRKVDAWRDRRVVALGTAIGRLSRSEQQRLTDAIPALSALIAELEALGSSG